MHPNLNKLLQHLRDLEYKTRQMPGLLPEDRAVAMRVCEMLREAGDYLADPRTQHVRGRPATIPPASMARDAPSGKCPWYVTAAAVREFLGHGFMDDTPDNFETAETQLMSICENQARLAKDEGHRQIWRTASIRFLNRKAATRLELTVSLAERSEGQLPQLVRVRPKGNHR